MYQRGDLRMKTNHIDHSRVDDSRNDYADLNDGDLYLPHSCGEWVIGGKEQITALIEDLQVALNVIDAIHTKR
jgi:hypothetical protein